MAKSKAGRKKIQVDWKVIDQALEAGASGVQVAAMLGISFDTLSRRCKEDNSADFAEYLRQKKESGNLKLLTAQFEEAVIERDRGMLIWLGKQRLGQKDKHDIDHTSNGKDMGVAPINWVNNDSKDSE